MNIAIGFGITETEFERAEGEAFVNFVTEAYSKQTCGYFSSEFTKKVRDWVDDRASKYRAAAKANDKSANAPDRYSYYFGDVAESASNLVLVATFMHINRRHALSPDGWALLKNVRTFAAVSALDLQHA